MQKKKVGVIVGRFQVPELTEGHKHLIKEVTKEFDLVYILIGTTKDNKPGLRNPLPLEARLEMFLEDNETIDHTKTTIMSIRDVGNWPVWVKDLEKIIEGNLLIEEKDCYDIFICGSRDSVADRYKEFGGKYNVFYVSELPGISGTLSREKLLEEDIKWNLDTRKAIIKVISSLYEN